MMFECDRCGLCCRSLKEIDILSPLNRGDGVCRYLENNLCSIYNDRPIICRVDDCYEKFFKNIMTKEEYYTLNYESCKLLKAKEKER